MCATCGCQAPKNKHGEKTLASANKKFAKKSPAKKAMSPKQEKIASKAAPKNKITGSDLKALRKGK